MSIGVAGYSGFDTETVHGYAVICSHQDRSWQSHTFQQCIQPLFNDVTNNRISGRFFTYNMDYDLRAMFKYLSEDDLRKILKDEGGLIQERYKIKYIPSKFCRIKDTKYKRTISFYDLAQFFAFKHLDELAKNYLDDAKLDSEVIRNVNGRQLAWSRERMDWYFAHNMEEIMEYCKHDAEITLKLGKFCSEKIREMFGITLSSFTSQAAIAERLTTDGTMKKPYPYFYAQSRVGRYARAAYRGGMFDINKRGKFDQVTDVDISSAYPSVMTTLPNWSNGRFIEVKNELDLLDDDYYGWVLCEFDCQYIPYVGDDYHEFLMLIDNEEYMAQTNNKRLYYPVGKRVQIITLHEYRFLKKYGFYHDFGNAYVWRPYKDEFINPFNWIQGVYNEKAEIKKTKGKKSYEYTLTKVAMTGGYGKTCQRKGACRMQNFFYASYITAETRVKIAEFIIDHKLQDKWISIATDGILLDGYYEFDDLGSGLGSWDLDYYDSALVLGNGMYQLYAKDKNKTALRGISKDSKFDLMGLIEKNKDKEFVKFIKKRPVSLFMGLQWKKYTLDDVNVWKPRGRKIKIDSDTTKKWFGIKTFDDLLKGNFTGERYTIKELEDQANKKDKVQKTLDQYN